MVRTLLSRSFRLPVSRFRTTTRDGVLLVGARLGQGPALVLTHGFLGWHRKPSIVGFSEQLARWFRVHVFDLRGHGESEGSSTFGDREYLDVDAIVRLARAGADAVATFGASMGGIAVLRQAAYRGGVDAVMAVSTPARWDGHGSRAVQRMRWFTATRAGRGLARALGYRLSDTWRWPDDPEDVVGDIAPTPLIVVHGLDDGFFDAEEAWRLYRRAREPKRLMLARTFGHAESGFTPAFAERAARRLYSAMDLPWPG